MHKQDLTKVTSEQNKLQACGLVSQRNFLTAANVPHCHMPPNHKRNQFRSSCIEPYRLIPTHTHAPSHACTHTTPI